MRLRLLVLTALAVAIVVAASAVTVYAWMGSGSPEVEEAIETAPVIQPEVVEPVLQLERVNYSGKGDCPYQEAKMQQVHAPVEEVNDQLLTQARP